MSDPAALTLAYLYAMERRDLRAATAMLDPDFVMQFPGAPPMTELSELIAWAAPRYRFVRKAHDAVEVVSGDPAVVYLRGTLAGEWPDGEPFEDVRFVDRFEVTGGKIKRQDVWNDLGEVRR